MGDYASFEHVTNPLLMRIRDEFGVHPFDEADETFKNVSGRLPVRSPSICNAILKASTCEPVRSAGANS